MENWKKVFFWILIAAVPGSLIIGGLWYLLKGDDEPEPAPKKKPWEREAGEDRPARQRPPKTKKKPKVKAKPKSTQAQGEGPDDAAGDAAGNPKTANGPE